MLICHSRQLNLLNEDASTKVVCHEDDSFFDLGHQQPLSGRIGKKCDGEGCSLAKVTENQYKKNIYIIS